MLESSLNHGFEQNLDALALPVPSSFIELFLNFR